MKYLIAIAALFFIGCATIVKTDRQSVNFSGPEDVVAKIQTPDGNYEVRGNTTLMLSRTKEDIPIEVTCNGITSKGVVKTQFDWGWGGAGNIVFGGIPGWIIDGVGNKSYDPPKNYNISPLCSEKRATASEHP